MCASGNGSANVTIDGYTSSYEGLLDWAAPSRTSGEPFTLGSTGKTLGLSYDAFGNLDTFNGTSLTMFAKSTVQGSNANTIVASATVIPAGTALAAATGP